MRNAQCMQCLNKFHEKEIYTIQQFQYRKEPSYRWSREFFERSGIGEWDSFCEKCMGFHADNSMKAWAESRSKLFIETKKAKIREPESRKSEKVSKRTQ